MQRGILSSLDAKGGRVTTEALMKEISPAGDLSDAFRISFYRALRGLLKRGRICWDKEHGGHKSPYGQVSSRRKRILLIDVDSTILNLALAKISSYHKSQGNIVELQRGQNVASRLVDYDAVYISCVFTKSADTARKLARQFPKSVVHLGGSGVDLVTELPLEIERMKADNSIYYDIYPETKYTNYGFFVRGCIRKCTFCVVPIKERGIHVVADLYDVWDGKAKKIVAFDNNILAAPNHFRLIAEQVMKEKLSLDMNQGMDIRLVNEENAKILAGLKFDPYMRFSWDSIKTEKAVLKGIEILKANGALKYPAFWYVLIGFDSDFEEDLYRINTLRELGQKCFAMRYNGNTEIMKDKKYDYLVNWTNGKMHYWSRTFEEYVAGKENGLQKRMAAENKKKKMIEEKQGNELLKFSEVA
jgi:hypothetical protein